jgi:divalent metal cation (Fe/Co/Zn/Cd) transporter
MAVERADLEAKLREIEEIVDETKSQAQTTGTVLAIAAVVAVVLIFLVGRRRGRRTGGARVEIYRV